MLDDDEMGDERGDGLGGQIRFRAYWRCGDTLDMWAGCRCVQILSGNVAWTDGILQRWRAYRW